MDKTLNEILRRLVERCTEIHNLPDADYDALKAALQQAFMEGEVAGLRFAQECRKRSGE